MISNFFSASSAVKFFDRVSRSQRELGMNTSTVEPAIDTKMKNAMLFASRTVKKRNAIIQ